MKFVWKKTSCYAGNAVGTDYVLSATDTDLDIRVTLCARKSGNPRFSVGSVDLYGDRQIWSDGNTLAEVMVEIEVDCLLEQKCRAIRYGDRSLIRSELRDSNAETFTAEPS